MKNSIIIRKEAQGLVDTLAKHYNNPAIKNAQVGIEEFVAENEGSPSLATDLSDHVYNLNYIGMGESQRAEFDSFIFDFVEAIE